MLRESVTFGPLPEQKRHHGKTEQYWSNRMGDWVVHACGRLKDGPGTPHQL